MLLSLIGGLLGSWLVIVREREVKKFEEDTITEERI